MTIATSNSFNYYGQLLAQLSAGISSQITQAVAAGADFSATLEAAVSVETSTAEPRTPDGVKREFYSYLDSLAVDPGLSRASISVTVTDAAFEKMLADPEYEQRMKDLCARDLCDPGWSKAAGMGLAASTLVIVIDPDAGEEYLAASYNYPDARGKADGDSFWSRRTKNRAAAHEAQERRDEEKRMTMEAVQERAAERKVLSQEMFYGSLAGFGTGDDSGSDALSAL